MTAEQTRNTAAGDGAPVVRLPRRPGRPAEPDLRERLGEFRALLVISLLMTESVNEEQILELAASSAPGLGLLADRGIRVHRRAVASRHGAQPQRRPAA